MTKPSDNGGMTKMITWCWESNSLPVNPVEIPFQDQGQYKCNRMDVQHFPPFRDEMTRFSTTNFNLQRFWEPGACVCFQVQSFGIVGIPVPNPGAFSLQLMVSSLSLHRANKLTNNEGRSPLALRRHLVARACSVQQ